MNHLTATPENWNDEVMTCNECGEEKEYVEEPMVSGFKGYLCVNDDCVMDS